MQFFPCPVETPPQRLAVQFGNVIYGQPERSDPLFVGQRRQQVFEPSPPSAFLGVYLPHMARNMFVDLADKSPIRRGTARGHAHASLFVELLGKQLAGSEKIPADAGV